MAQIIDLGKLRFVFRGTYSGSTTYELNDVVRYGGNLYVYKNVLEASGNLPTVTTHWDLMLEGIDFKGVYNNTTAYRIGDLVTEGAKGYICIADTTGNRPPNGTFWATIVDGLQYEGAYAGGTTYQAGDVVTFGGSAYICILRTTGNAPTDTTYWALLVDGAFPNQTGNETKVLTTDGTSTSWTDAVTLTTLTTRSDITVNGDADVRGNVSAGTRSVDVTNKTIVSNVVTLTTDGAHYFDVGDRVVVAGVGAGYNGGALITAVTTNTFSYATSTNNDTGGPVSPVGTATVIGNLSSDGKLDVAGITTLNSVLNAEGGIAVDINKFTVDTSGNTRMEGDLEVDTGALLYVGNAAKDDADTIGENIKPTTFKARNNNIATITTASPHGFAPFQFVVVSINDLTFDGEVEIIDVPTPTTFTYASSGTNVSQTNAAGSGLQVSAVTGWTNPVAIFSIEGDDYSQVVMHNTSSDPNASSDFIAYPDNGNDFAGYIDMGITSSSFADPEFTITGANDGYIFVTAPYGSSGGGNLVLATGDTGTENKIIFAAGGLASDNTQMEITPDVNVHIEIPTPSTSPTTGALTVVGGVGIQGDMNIQGNVNIVGTITFGGSGTSVTTNNLSVGEPMIFSGAANPADVIDLGLIGEYARTVSAITNTVTNKALTTNVATLTTGTAHTYRAGDWVVVSGVDATFNGTYQIKTVPTSTTFTYDKTAANVTSAAVSPVGATSVTLRREFAGLVRDASDGIYKLFTAAVTKPATTVNFSEAGLTRADLEVKNLTATGNLTVTGSTTFNSDVTIVGGLRMQELVEDVVDVSLNLANNNLDLNYNLGSVFWITNSTSGNQTWNITNAPTTDGRTFTITGFYTSNGNASYPATLNVNGSGVSIRWFGQIAPTATATNGRIDIYNFTIIRRGSSWTALGNASLNFGTL